MNKTLSLIKKTSPYTIFQNFVYLLGGLYSLFLITHFVELKNAVLFLLHL